MAIRGKYGKWNEEDMERAIMSFNNGDMGLNAVAKCYGVPKATLKRRLDGKNIYATESKKILGRLPDLPQEIENDLVSHVLQLEEMFFGVTREDLKKLAFQVAAENGIENRFDKEKKSAGDKWYYKFISRHPELTLRTPEPTSIARASGFNKQAVEDFYTKLKSVVDTNGIDAMTLYNMDETGLSTVHKPRKVLAQKGKHQVGAVTSGERGITTTGIFCMSAGGSFIPPVLIFKRNRFKNELKYGAPPGTAFACSETGWTNSEIFVQWLKHFVAFTKPSIEQKILLLLDGHSTHTKNIDAINYARDNGIIMMSFPAHVTHKMQPLDVSFFKPLKTYYNEAADKWLRTNVGQKITQFQISQLVGESYGRAATISIAINGFKKCGIWPVDNSVLDDSEFAPSFLSSAASLQLEVPSTSSQSDLPYEVGSKTLERDLPTNQAFKSVAEISPLPAVNDLNGKRKRRTTSTKAIVLTSTPHKEQIEKCKGEKHQESLSRSRNPKLPRRKLQLTRENKSWYCSLCETEEQLAMVRCTSCRNWHHEKCANISPKQKMYSCINCK